MKILVKVNIYTNAEFCITVMVVGKSFLILVYKLKNKSTKNNCN